MKFKRIMSITITNSYLLFIFASLLAGCEKRKIPNTGYFNSKNLASRSLASVAPKDKTSEFLNFQEPQQIMVYCAYNASRIENCYHIHFNKTLQEFIEQAKRKPTPQEIESIKSTYSFKKVNEIFEQRINIIKKELNLKITSHIKKQKNFCDKNSKLNMKRCMEQFVERDTLSVLNNFQFKHKLNGHEYLFIKKTLEDQYLRVLNNVITTGTI